MLEYSIINKLLNFGSDWQIEDIKVNETIKEVDIFLKYSRSRCFLDESEPDCLIYDYTATRRLRHLDLFNYNAQDASASVGIILDTAFRGQALAKVALTLLEHEVKNKWGIERLRAKVFLDNTISISLFRRLGYEEIKHCLEKDYEGVTKKVLISEKILK